MTEPITITDDTGRRTQSFIITHEMRVQAMAAGNPIPDKLLVLPATDQRGRRIQEPDVVEHTFEGRHLEIAIKRAKRWVRKHGLEVKPPKHIALAMAAFFKAQPEEFEALVA